MSKGPLHIIVDGYNLIGVYHNRLHDEREKLINRLIEYKKAKGHELVVVFDGWASDRGEVSQPTGGIGVLFSRYGERADDLIKKIIREYQRRWIVVSSDREIISFAWANNSVPIKSDEFLKRLAKTGQTKISHVSNFSNEHNDYDHNYGYRQGGKRKKGNPRTLSKKDKSIRTVLDKL